VLNYIKHRVQKACAYLEQVVRNVWDRLLNQPGYADAAADVLTYAVQLCCRNWVLVGFVHQVVQGLAALIRNLIRSRNREDALPWQFA